MYDRILQWNAEIQCQLEINRNTILETFKGNASHRQYAFATAIWGGSRKNGLMW
jgi:hypothetical protein